MGGIGWQTTRFYGYRPPAAAYTSAPATRVPTTSWSISGSGLRYYVWGHVFVRPEAHYYKIFNNTATSPPATLSAWEHRSVTPSVRTRSLPCLVGGRDSGVQPLATARFFLAVRLIREWSRRALPIERPHFDSLRLTN